MRRSSSALTAAIFVGLMTIAQQAQAKFNIRVVISGPGLTGPVELLNPGIAIGCVFSRPCSPASRPPEGPLGPRYDVTQSLEGTNAHGPMMDRIVHELYPYARGGPLVFTAARQTRHDWNRERRVPAGWNRASDELVETLRANGLPERPPGRPVRGAEVDDSTGQERSTDSGANPMPVGVVLLATLVAGAMLLSPARRDGQSR